MRLVLPIFIIIVSFIYGLPNLILSSKLGGNYTPFTLRGSPIARDETFAYAPEVNYILSGKFSLREVYAYEYADYPSPFLGETVPALLMAAITKVTGSLAKSFIVSDFIFPPVIFFGFFIFAKIFIKNNLLALSAAFTAVIARDLVAVIPYPWETLKYLTFAENQNYLLYFSRAFHPQISFVFFLGAVLMVFKTLEKPKSKTNLVTLGIFSGLTFYSYVFYWTLFAFFYIVFIIYLIFKKQLPIVKSFVISGLIALIIASFYMVDIYHFYQLSFTEDFITKSSLHNVPLPVTLLRYLAFATVFLLGVKKKDHNFAAFATLLFAGILITPVSKFIIGQDLETFHYLRRALMPFFTICLFTVAYFFLNKRRIIVNIAAIILVGITVLLGARTQIIATEKIQPNHVRNRDLESVMTWLEINTQKSQVIGSLDPDFSSLIPVYTKNKVFVPPTDRTIMPTYEGIEKYKILSELLGMTGEWQKQRLKDAASYFFVYQSYDQNRNLDQNSSRMMQAQAQVDELERNEKWKEKLNSYKLDYIVITPSETDLIRPNISYLNFKTSVNQYIVFKVK